MFIYTSYNKMICDENQAIDNGIIPQYMTATLKHSMHMT